jgi:hypothetical protein
VIEIRAQLLESKGDNEQAYLLLKQFNQREVALFNKNSSDRLLALEVN